MYTLTTSFWDWYAICQIGCQNFKLFPSIKPSERPADTEIFGIGLYRYHQVTADTTNTWYRSFKKNFRVLF